MHTHFDAFNSLDRSRWEAVRRSWENSFRNGQSWLIEPLLMQICSDQAACHVRNTGIVAGKDVVVDSIEAHTIDDAGKVAYLHTWFTPPEGTVLDPYFMAHAGAD